LPLIQYTAREVRSGLLFWSFAQDRSASASAVFASRIQQHLNRCGVSLRDLVWQTDNGGEFKGDFPSALLDSQHVRIPPAAHTYQSDVETVHRLEEDEFFDLESFTSRGDFLAKTHTYQLYFNLVRTNSHKENLSPWQIIERLAPRSPLDFACFHPSSWITTSMTPGDTMSLAIPTNHKEGNGRANCQRERRFPRLASMVPHFEGQNNFRPRRAIGS
jgi:hypothetical protein